jgi:hypothetical protein
MALAEGTISLIGGDGTYSSEGAKQLSAESPQLFVPGGAIGGGVAGYSYALQFTAESKNVISLRFAFLNYGPEDLVLSVAKVYSVNQSAMTGTAGLSNQKQLFFGGSPGFTLKSPQAFTTIANKVPSVIVSDPVQFLALTARTDGGTLPIFQVRGHFTSVSAYNLYTPTQIADWASKIGNREWLGTVSGSDTVTADTVMGLTTSARVFCVPIFTYSEPSTKLLTIGDSLLRGLKGDVTDSDAVAGYEYQSLKNGGKNPSLITLPISGQKHMQSMLTLMSAIKSGITQGAVAHFMPWSPNDGYTAAAKTLTLNQFR